MTVPQFPPEGMSADVVSHVLRTWENNLHRLRPIVLMTLLIVAMLLLWKKDNSGKTEANQGDPVMNAPRQDNTTGTSTPEEVQRLKQNSRAATDHDKSYFDINNVEAAWAASTGSAALDQLRNSDLTDSQVVAFLMLARASCKIALYYSDPSSKAATNVLSSNNALANAQFLDNYCGRDEKLIQRIDLALSPAREKMKREFPALARGETTQQRPPEQDTDLDKLISASHKSSVAADALINELLAARSPDAARILAQALSSATEGEGVLVAWNKYLPTNAQRLERIEAFTIAGELLACQRLAGCGPGAVLSMYQCAVGGPGRCQPGEDLLSYRRRTTSPMLYQAAEQIAAAMQARRYR
jgi:hypothetical protein